MKLIFCISLFLCPYINSAQQPLSVGDKLPTSAMQQLTNTAKGQPSLYILDFWATWCSSCLKNLPKVAALQAANKNKVQVVLVNSAGTGDDDKKINTFFKKYYAANPGQQTFTQLKNDRVFTGLFPFESVPHYVWIDSTATVLAITGSQDVTAQNIRKAITGQPLQLLNKADMKVLAPGTSIFFANESLASLAPTSAGFADTARYAYLPGIIKYAGTGFQSFLATGQPLLSLYRRSLHFPSNRMRMLLPAGHALLQTPVNAELILPGNCTQQEADEALRQLLNRSFNLHGRMQMIEARCYMLGIADTALFNSAQRRAAAIRKAGTDSIFYKNKSPLYITNTMNSILPKNAHWPIIINNPAFTQPISLVLPGHALSNNPAALQQALQPWGLCLLQTTTSLPFFVLEQVQTTPSLTKTITTQ